MKRGVKRGCSTTRVRDALDIPPHLSTGCAKMIMDLFVSSGCTAGVRDALDIPPHLSTGC